MSKLLPFLLVLGALLAGCKHIAIDHDHPDREWFEAASHDELSGYIEASTNSPLAYYERGKRYAELGRYPEALLDGETCIERWPRHVNGYWLRGWLLSEQQAYENALLDYNKAVELAPDERRLYIQRGGIHIKLDEVHLALSDFNRAIELDQTDYFPYLMRGIIYFGAILNPERAEADFSKSIELWPESSFTFLMRGGLYYWLQKDDLALADFNSAIELEPDRADGYLSRATLYYRQKDAENALADYQKVYELEPSMYGVLKRVGDLFVMTGELDAATDAYRGMLYWYGRQDDPFSSVKLAAPSIEMPQANRAEVLKVYPESDELYVAWAKLSYDNQNYKDALALVDRGIELNPENMDLILFRGAIRGVLEDQGGALRNINRAIEMNPVYAMSYISRAAVQHQYGQPRLAIEDYTKAIELSGEVAFIYYLRAGAYSDFRLYDFAKADHDKSVELSNGNIVYRRARSFFYEKNGRPDRALDYYNSEIEACSDSYLPYAERGAFFKRTKRYDEALADYTIAIEKALEFGVSAKKLRSCYLDRSGIFLALEKNESALKDATAAVECTAGEDYFAYSKRAIVNDNLNQSRMALADYKKAIELNPNDEKSRYYRAGLLYRMKRYDEALEEYSVLISRELGKDAIYWQALRGRAEIFVLRGEFEKAIQDMDEILIHDPTKQDLIERRRVIAEYAGIAGSPIPGMLLLEKIGRTIPTSGSVCSMERGL
ncbi:tetratricopeptide repeat protein [Pontiellaceae bacterium B12227]|nr:tetratricopeptide repeat protein [Pontiellaceae bacterium B12227]